MAKRKAHCWQKLKDVPYASRCSRCKSYKYQPPGEKAHIFKDGHEDTSTTKNNCFTLSKD